MNSFSCGGAPDKWDASRARFTGIFLASGFFCSQAESTPAHLRVTQTVRQPSAKTKLPLNRKFGFSLSSKSKIVFLVWSFFLAAAFASFSCFKIFVLVFKFQACKFCSAFQIIVLHLVKVLVNCGLRFLGYLFVQVTLAQVFCLAMFIFGKVRFSKSASFLWSKVLVNFV